MVCYMCYHVATPVVMLLPCIVKLLPCVDGVATLCCHVAGVGHAMMLLKSVADTAETKLSELSKSSKLCLC